MRREVIWVMALICFVPFVWAADTLMEGEVMDTPVVITKTPEQQITARISTLEAQKKVVNDKLTIAINAIKATAIDANAMVTESRAILAETKQILESSERTLENKSAVVAVVDAAVDVNDVEQKAQWVVFLTDVIELAQEDLAK